MPKRPMNAGSLAGSSLPHIWDFSSPAGVYNFVFSFTVQLPFWNDSAGQVVFFCSYTLINQYVLAKRSCGFRMFLIFVSIFLIYFKGVAKDSP